MFTHIQSKNLVVVAHTNLNVWIWCRLQFSIAHINSLRIGIISRELLWPTFVGVFGIDP